MKKFLVAALEPSANLHLKELLKAYQAEFGDFSLFGIFDEKISKDLNLNSSKNDCLNSLKQSDLNAMGQGDLNLSQNKNLTTAKQNDLNLPKHKDLNAIKQSDLNFTGQENPSQNFPSSQNSSQSIINKPLYSSHEFSAMGFVEVLPLIFKAKKAIKKLVNLALLMQDSQNPFDAILCIDSPAFNIPFAKALNKAGVKAKKVYYILPQVWAWKKGRIPIIEANFDVLASILPFENKFFRKSTFVGHPLLDEIKEFKSEEQRQELLKKEHKQRVVAFLPGSRKSEITRLMPVFRELALNFEGEKILCVPPFRLENLDKLYGDTSGFKVVTNTPQALKKSDFAFICSGTASLEAAIVGTPFVLAYKAKAIDVLIARCFVKLKHIGLANIMCDFADKGELHPEFLQGEVNAKNLFEAYRKFNFKVFFAKVSFLKNYLQFGSAKNLAEILNK